MKDQLFFEILPKQASGLVRIYSDVKLYIPVCTMYAVY